MRGRALWARPIDWTKKIRVKRYPASGGARVGSTEARSLPLARRRNERVGSSFTATGTRGHVEGSRGFLYIAVRGDNERKDHPRCRHCEYISDEKRPMGFHSFSRIGRFAFVVVGFFFFLSSVLEEVERILAGDRRHPCLLLSELMMYEQSYFLCLQQSLVR